MEKLHGSRPFDQGEPLLFAFSEGTPDTVSAAEIISSLCSTDYHRSLSWL